MIQRRVLVSGRVQGVGFRAATQREAEDYPGLKGFVRNLRDGRVEAVFKGEASQVFAMVSWCKKGPPMSHVEQIELFEEAPDPGLVEFGIQPSN